LAAVFELIRETNRLLDGGKLAPGQARSLADWLADVHSVLALEPEAASLPAEVQTLLGLRAQARASKDWKASDSIRDQIATLGWTVKDTKDGQKAIRL